MRNTLALILTIIFLAASTAGARAQKDSISFDLGINTFRLLEWKRSSVLDPDVWNPYVISANINAKKIAFRLGAGLNKSTKTELPAAANGMSTRDSIENRSDLRFGVGWNFDISPKWVLRAGVDFIRANSESTFRTEFVNEAGTTIVTTHSITQNEKGIAPFVGIQYFITSRVHVGTEMSFRSLNYTSRDRDESNLNSALIERAYQGSKNYFMAPTVLYLNLRF
ncbi:MAG: hypothetical protein ACKOZY_01270 [Flavobacteriales bacterium]